MIARGHLVLIMALLGNAALAKNPPSAEKPVALVNGEPISREDFEQALKRLPPSPVALTETQQKALRMNVLGMLADELLLKQFLRKHAGAPEPAAIEQCVAKIEAGQKAKGRTLQDFCRENGHTEERLRADMAALVQWHKYLDQRITETELRRYYTDNKDVFDGVSIRASHILLIVPSGSDEKTHQAKQEKLRSIRMAIVGGLDFADAAKRHSQDPSGANGGDVGFFPPPGSDPDPFLRTASALKAGQMSDVIKTEYGYHLIKVTERKPGKPSTFDEMKAAVRDVYADELKIQIINEQRKTAKIEVNLP